MLWRKTTETFTEAEDSEKPQLLQRETITAKTNTDREPKRKYIILFILEQKRVLRGLI